MRTFSLDTEAITEESYQSKTYAMQASKIEGYVDGLGAVKQAVEKILNTEKYEYPIYSFSYGAEMQKLIGKERPYVRAELKRIITDALTHDSRIKSVSGFSFSFHGDCCTCNFYVESTEGTLNSSVEVSI